MNWLWRMLEFRCGMGRGRQLGRERTESRNRHKQKTEASLDNNKTYFNGKKEQGAHRAEVTHKHHIWWRAKVNLAQQPGGHDSANGVHLVESPWSVVREYEWRVIGQTVFIWFSSKLIRRFAASTDWLLQLEAFSRALLGTLACHRPWLPSNCVKVNDCPFRKSLESCSLFFL